MVRVQGESGSYSHDVIGLADEDPSGAGHALLDRVMVGGRRSGRAPDLESVQKRTHSELQRFPGDVRDMQQSGQYSVRVSQTLEALLADLSDALQNAEQ